jgi:hypothetical protein
MSAKIFFQAQVQPGAILAPNVYVLRNSLLLPNTIAGKASRKMRQSRPGQSVIIEKFPPNFARTGSSPETSHSPTCTDTAENFFVKE